MTDDRRRQDAASNVPGRRRTDPTLKTSDCALATGLTAAYFRGEIKHGRLIARINIKVDEKRSIYRISEADFEAWMVKYNHGPHERIVSAMAIIAAIKNTRRASGIKETEETDEPSD